MGNSMKCEKCPVPNTNTVFTFSEPLVLKLSEGIQPEPEQIKAGHIRNLADREWMDRIRCIEDVHTHAYSLSQDGFDKIFSQVEKSVPNPVVGSTNAVLQKVRHCYKKHPADTLRCRDDIKKFIDDIDTARLETMKNKFVNEEKT